MEGLKISFLFTGTLGGLSLITLEHSNALETLKLGRFLLLITELVCVLMSFFHDFSLYKNETVVLHDRLEGLLRRNQ